MKHPIKNNELNVFKFDYMPLTYWKNWFTNIAQFFRNIKWAYQRAVYGFCERDTFSLDCYLSQLIPEMLDYLSDTCIGYPGNDNDPRTATYEAWTDTLREIATHFRNSQDWNNNTPVIKEREDLLTEMCKYVRYDKEYLTKTGNITKSAIYSNKEEYDRLSELLNSKSIESYKYIEQEKDLAFDLMKKYFFNLWD